MIKTPLNTLLKSYNFEKLFAKKGYKYFTKGEYNLNIIGIRTNHNNQVTNKFDDYLIVIYKTATKENRQIYNITTEPGLYYMKNMMNSKGTAILVPGQYLGAWQIAKHRGKYDALCQRKPIKVYRDGNKDAIYDLEPEKVDTGIFGVNIHRSSQWSTVQDVDKYSAGCQVFNDFNQFISFMKLCKKQRDIYGNSFTYTLINEDDLYAGY